MHAAYFAGLFDGEGTIGLPKHSKGRARRPVIAVSMTDPEPIEAMATLGGFVREKPGRGGRRTMYHWQANNFAALNVLETLLPFLVIERRRKIAELLTSDTVLPAVGVPSKIAHAEHLFRTMKEINAQRLDYVPEIKPKQPRTADWAYLAGLLDGEGYIGVERNTVQVASTDPEVLAWCRSRFGGGVYLNRRKNPKPNHKPVWAWHSSRKNLKWTEKIAADMQIPRKREALLRLEGC